MTRRSTSPAKTISTVLFVVTMTWLSACWGDKKTDAPPAPQPGAPPAPAPKSAERTDASLPELVIYTYDSMVAEGGLGPKIFPLFEKQCGCHVRPLASGDAGAMVARLKLDLQRGKPQAQVVLGIDRGLWKKARDSFSGWRDWEPADWKAIPAEFKGDDGFLPFDYGIYAFIADMDALKKAGLAPPKSFKELADPKWKRRLIVEDPRTSTPGDAFFTHVSGLFGTLQEMHAFSERLRPSFLTIAPGWDAAYALFLKGEASLVWSYTTSEAYHREEGKGDRYKAVIFDEPHPFQVEGAALVTDATDTTAQTQLARRFLAFLISPEAQREIPKGNWMLPVRPGTPLPASFKDLPRPKKIVEPKAYKVGVGAFESD